MSAAHSTGVARIGTDAQRSKPSNEYALDRKGLLTLEATAAGTVASRILDQRDADIVRERLARMERIEGPRVGDFVIFPVLDGERVVDTITRRISHAFYVADGWQTSTFQTSDISGGGYAHGRWYLGDAGCSFSGGLHTSVEGETLTDTGECRDGTAWIFHHDHKTAHNGIDFVAPFRVFACSVEAPR